MQDKTLILVVDDEERNLRVMETILLPKNYEVLLARNGEEAIEKAKSRNPDAILLDVMMPVMNGFEACRRLKADAETSSIPVLLVTALESREDRLKGIEAGATDFISKPVDIEYLLLKVRNAVYAKNLFNMVQKNFEEQKQLEEVRDKLTHLIVHDLRMPLMGISGNMEFLKMEAKDSLSADHVRYIDQTNSMIRTMVDLVNSILAVNRIEKGNIEIILNQDSLKDLIFEAIELLGPLKTKCNMVISCKPGPVSPLGDRDLIRNIMLNLLSNAVKYTTNGDNYLISISGETDGLRIRIADTRPGVPEKYHNKIIEQSGSAAISKERRLYSTGLGLAFCKMAVEARHGEFGTENEEGKDSVFWCFLPWIIQSDKV